MCDDTMAFFSMLHRGGAFAYYHALPDRRSWWYPTTDPLLPPRKCRDGCNWYFGVHPTTAIPPTNAHGTPSEPAYVRAQRPYIAAINCLYAEYDAKHYDGSKRKIMDHIAGIPYPMPSVVIDSGGGIHCYWLLKTPFILENDDRREAARIIQRLWVHTVGADATVHDLTRVLRIPGTRNYKYPDAPYVEYLRYDLDRSYALQTLTGYLPAIEEDPPRYKVAHSSTSIADYNRDTDIADLLMRFGYKRHGRYRLTSPHSGSGRDGVSIDSDRNRCFIHTGGDPLCDGYWHSPFDVLMRLEYHGDFDKALRSLRGRS